MLSLHKRVHINSSSDFYRFVGTSKTGWRGRASFNLHLDPLARSCVYCHELSSAPTLWPASSLAQEAEAKLDRWALADDWLPESRWASRTPERGAPAHRSRDIRHRHLPPSNRSPTAAWRLQASHAEQRSARTSAIPEHPGPDHQGHRPLLLPPFLLLSLQQQPMPPPMLVALWALPD